MWWHKASKTDLKAISPQCCVSSGQTFLRQPWGTRVVRGTTLAHLMGAILLVLMTITRMTTKRVHLKKMTTKSLKMTTRRCLQVQMKMMPFTVSCAICSLPMLHSGRTTARERSI